ncbi:gliding motility lipoprotein GldH [Flexithrix dorotheae]|uniref:gliding motility lipoprotein GldH n=1 Tax=Flexithrix dorotheae TaxID=70993 RepID=UPI00039D4F2D|nr:gliding motility lipoprotein GldH [Flexithrix dorotheae]
MTKNYTLCLIFSILILSSGCSNQVVYENYIDLNDNYWAEDNQLEFAFEIQDSGVPYDLSVYIRNGLSYPFYNLYVKYELLDDKKNTVLSSEMKETSLMDPTTGRPLGSGVGDFYNNEMNIFSDFKFQSPGKYSLKINQYMRMDSLPDITAIGLKVAKSED